jgi:prephenate dehydrogenase
MTDTPRSLPVIQPGPSASAPPVFEKVAIVGLGLIGGSLALAVRETWPGGLVIGVDDKPVLERAMLRHAIDVAADDPVVMAEADLVVLAAPVRTNLALLADLEEHVRGSSVVTDVGSTKRDVVEAARVLPARLTFIGGHPLGGAPRSGIDHARPDLFRDRPWLFTPTDDRHGETLERLRRFVIGFGAVPHVLAPDAHDRLLAFLSHVPQLTASVLMHVVGDAIGEDGLAMSGRGLADTTRLASSPADIWRDICGTNATEIGAALDALIAELQAVREHLADGEAIDRVFESASRWRAALAARRRAPRGE